MGCGGADNGELPPSRGQGRNVPQGDSRGCTHGWRLPSTASWSAGILSATTTASATTTRGECRWVGGGRGSVRGQHPA
jgi:hypothetical protein